MSRLLYWGRIAVDQGMITKQALELGQWYWDLLRNPLRRVERIQSPVFSLVKQTAGRPTQDWRVASNHVLLWCAFGDRAKVLSTLQRIREAAREQMDTEPLARKVLEVIEFILNDTNSLEPTLGLRAALQR